MPSSRTRQANWPGCAKPWPGTPTRSGGTSWRVTGSDWTKRCRSWAAPATAATSSGHARSPHDSSTLPPTWASCCPRPWPPYPKWRGTVFGRLPGCAAIATDLVRVLDSRHWHDRQTALSDALTGLANLQREGGLPVPESAVEPFWDRPYIHLSRSLVPGLLETLSRRPSRGDPRLSGRWELESIIRRSQRLGPADHSRRRARWLFAIEAVPAGRALPGHAALRRRILDVIWSFARGLT